MDVARKVGSPFAMGKAGKLSADVFDILQFNILQFNILGIISRRY